MPCFIRFASFQVTPQNVCQKPSGNACYNFSRTNESLRYRPTLQEPFIDTARLTGKRLFYKAGSAVSGLRMICEKQTAVLLLCNSVIGVFSFRLHRTPRLAMDHQLSTGTAGESRRRKIGQNSYAVFHAQPIRHSHRHGQPNQNAHANPYQHTYPHAHPGSPR